MSERQAIILGGSGARACAPTISLKPLVPVGEYPIIEIVLRQLKARLSRSDHLDWPFAD